MACASFHNAAITMIDSRSCRRAAGDLDRREKPAIKRVRSRPCGPRPLVESDVCRASLQSAPRRARCRARRIEGVAADCCLCEWHLRGCSSQGAGYLVIGCGAVCRDCSPRPHRSSGKTSDRVETIRKYPFI
jgi:hypothetical protein